MAIQTSAANQGIGTTTAGNLPGFPFTIMGWFMITTDGNQNHNFISYGESATAALYLQVGADFTSTNTNLFVWDGSEVANGSNLSLNTWYHIALTIDQTAGASSTTRAYLNGILNITNAANNAAVTNEAWYIGDNSDNEFFQGRAAAIKVWSRELSQAEIQREMWTYVPQDHVNSFAWYPLFNIREHTRDYSGRDRTLTSQGAGAITADGPPITWGAPVHRRFYSYAVAAGGATAHELAFSISSFGVVNQRAVLDRVASVTIVPKVLTNENKVNLSLSTPIDSMRLILPKSVQAQTSLGAKVEVTKKFATQKTSNVAVNAVTNIQKQFVLSPHIVNAIISSINVSNPYLNSNIGIASVEQIVTDITNQYLFSMMTNVSRDNKFEISSSIINATRSVLAQSAILNLTHPYITSTDIQTQGQNSLDFIITTKLGLLAHAVVTRSIGSDIAPRFSNSTLVQLAQFAGISTQSRYVTLMDSQIVSDDTADFTVASKFSSLFRAVVASSAGFGPTAQADTEFLVDILGQEQIASVMTQQMGLSVAANVSSLAQFNITQVNRCDVLGGLSLGAGTTIISRSQFQNAVQRNLGLAVDLGGVFSDSVQSIHVTKQLGFTLEGKSYIVISTEGIAQEIPNTILQHVIFVLPMSRSLEFNLQMPQHIDMVGYITRENNYVL